MERNHHGPPNKFVMILENFKLRYFLFVIFTVFLLIEGVSLAKVQKEEFNSIIQSNDGDINALLKNLKEFVEK